jgi:predicted acylesterase/phospholipase RssA
MSVDTFKIYIFPISGGEFPNQLALLSQVYYAILENTNGSFPGSKGYAPDICFGCSGGNIAAYTGMAADWNPERIISICKEVDPQMFIRNWWPGPLGVLPSAIAGIVGGGSLYRSGYGVLPLFRELFPNPDKAMVTEILTLTFNQTEKKPQIFTNRGEDNSYLPPTAFTESNSFMYQVSDMTYNDGDIEKISAATMASYSIPLVVQPRSIDGEKHTDGGVSYASPFTPVHQLLAASYPPTSSRKLQITYFCSYDMNDPNTDRSSFYGKNSLGISLQQMLHTSILGDRALALQLLRYFVNNPSFEEGKKINTSELANLLLRLKDKNYALILYPSGAPYINILDFTAKDIIDTIAEASSNYNYFVYFEP